MIDKLDIKRLGKILVTGYPMPSAKLIFPKNKECYQILAVGRFSDPRKNLPMLIKSFRLLWEMRGDVILNIVGQVPDSDEMEKYNSLLNDLPIGFTGSVSQEQLDNYYKDADLFWITSYQEGLGIVGLEALQHGVPIVATKCGGVEDFVLNGKTGFLVERDDDLAMAVKTNMLLNNLSLRRRMSKNACELIDSRYQESFVFSLLKKGFVETWPELAAIVGQHEDSLGKTKKSNRFCLEY